MTKPFLAIGAIHKLEGLRLREWVEYHRLVGFDHFYLFDNNDVDDGSAGIVQHYVDRGIATSVKVNGKAPGSQMRVYEWLFRQQPAEWIAFIDIDEFVLPITTDNVGELIREYDRFGGLAISWRCFGTGRHVAAPAYITESLTRASKPDWPNNRHVKCIVKPERVVHCIDPHSYVTIPGQQIVNEHSRQMAGSIQSYTDSRIVINHYGLRSAEDFKLKAQRGRGDDITNPYDEAYFAHHNTNDVEETRLADRFAREVRRRCEGESA